MTNIVAEKYRICKIRHSMSQTKMNVIKTRILTKEFQQGD